MWGRGSGAPGPGSGPPGRGRGRHGRRRLRVLFGRRAPARRQRVEGEAPEAADRLDVLPRPATRNRIHRGGDAQIQNRLAAKLSTRVAERRQSLTSSGQPHSAPAAVADAVPAAGNGHALRVHGLPGAERASLAGGEFRRVTSDGVVQVQEAEGDKGRSDEIERRGPGLRARPPLLVSLRAYLRWFGCMILSLYEVIQYTLSL